jgi:hypothetical protein
LATCWVIVDPPRARPPPVTDFTVKSPTAPAGRDSRCRHAEERLVLGREERLDDEGRIFVIGEIDPPLAGEALDGSPS